ncbi:MAG: hypothetical protein PHU80_07035, partial [Kiritimatiellae bacterium]|nr:hypothetical protein [Kiritimatiellia bacterium]
MQATRRASIFLCAATAALLQAVATTLLPPFPETAAASPDFHAPLTTPDGLTLTAVFSNNADRVFWDLPLA